MRNRRLIIIFLGLLLILISYYVRRDYVAIGDINEPSDAREYQIAATTNIAPFAQDLLNGKAFTYPIRQWKEAVGYLNTHGVPLYIAYTAFWSALKIDHRAVTLIVNSILTGFLFFTAAAFLPLWIAIAVGLIAVVYTPLFVFLPTWMPDTFSASVLPFLFVAIAYLLARSRKPSALLLAGVLLAATGFTRHVFSYLGVLTLLLYWIIEKGKSAKHNIWYLLLGYGVPSGIWRGILLWTNIAPYAKGVILSALYYSLNLVNQGWYMGVGAPGISVYKILYLITHQNLFAQILLRLERIPMFYRNPAIEYAFSFPLPETILWILHWLLLFLSLWGLRQAFRKKILLYMALPFFWNTLLVPQYVVEDPRTQLSVAGLLILFAGFGLAELQDLFKSSITRKAVFLTSILFIIWIFYQPTVLSIELWLTNTIIPPKIFFYVHNILVGGVFLWATKKLITFERTQHSIIPHSRFRLIPAFIPLLGFLFILGYQLRNYRWHEWFTYLPAKQKIIQTIDLLPYQLPLLSETHGYVLIDVEDPNAGKNLEVMFNGAKLTQALPMSKSHSPVDLMAIRQWQQNWPRTNYSTVDEELANSPLWPSMHQWLIFPIEGKSLREKNQIEVQNTQYLTSSLPKIFGDYPGYQNGLSYHGPSPRIFAGKIIYNRYQILRDIRMSETRRVHSGTNTSMRTDSSGKQTDDLSVLLGKQSGRYRIFFLFPFMVGDPEDIF